MTEQHEMVLEETGAAGEENWYCPLCGRRMLITWQPIFKRKVLEVGDQNIRHSGFKTDSQMREFSANSSHHTASHEYEENVKLDIDESRLTPWENWINNIDFDDLGKSDTQ